MWQNASRRTHGAITCEQGEKDVNDKKNTIVCILVEAVGGIAPLSMRKLYGLANIFKRLGAYDRTRYGQMWQNARSSTDGAITCE